MRTQNHNHHETHSPKPSPKARPLDTSTLPVNVRRAFVDRACALMAESRYAPDRTSFLIVDLVWDPDAGHQLFTDVTAEGPAPSYPIASVVNCYSPADINHGVCLASRWAIRDLALASMAEALNSHDHPPGPSP